MTNLNVIYVGHSEFSEAFFHSNNDLFEELNKEFGNLYFVDANLFTKGKIDRNNFHGFSRSRNRNTIPK